MQTTERGSSVAGIYIHSISITFFSLWRPHTERSGKLSRTSLRTRDLMDLHEVWNRPVLVQPAGSECNGYADDNFIGL